MLFDWLTFVRVSADICFSYFKIFQFLFGELDKNIWQKNYAHQVGLYIRGLLKQSTGET